MLLQIQVTHEYKQYFHLNCNTYMKAFILKCMHFKMQHNKNMSSDLYNSSIGQDYKDFELPRPSSYDSYKAPQTAQSQFCQCYIISVLKY